MTENEAIEILEKIYEKYVKNCDDEKEYMENNFALTEAVKALSEIQQYRAIGTAEQLKDMKQNYAEALSDWRQYRKIGTVEECREARERQRAKKPVKDKYNHDCCPNCGWIVCKDEWGGRYLPHCENCGQAISWESDTP